MARALKKFCKIPRYIEQIDGEFAKMISDLCLERLFIPRGSNGITFLYPKDDDYRKEIITAAYSNHPEKAIQMVESLIILDYLPRPGDFIRKKDDIPNALRQRIEIASADASSVKLTCGATLHSDTDFAPISTRENMAVYHITNARVPLNGPKATMKYSAQKKNRNAAAAAGGQGPASADAARSLYEEIKAHTLEELKHLKPTSKALNVITSYLKFLLSKHPAHLSELVHAGRVPPCPLACFFTALNLLDEDVHVTNFVEEHRKSGYNHMSKNEDALVEFQALVKECYKKAGEASDMHEDEDTRLRLQKECASVQVPTQALAPALEAYAKYYKNKGNEVAKHLRWHELIFMTMRFIYDSNDEQTGVQKALYIKQAFDQYELVVKGSEPTLINPKLLKNRMDPALMYSGPWMLILSSLFLGGPMDPESWTSEHLGSSDPDAFNSPQNLDEKSMINMHAIMANMYKSGIPAMLTLGGMKDMMFGLE